jgi:hypothetical protein
LLYTRYYLDDEDEDYIPEFIGIRIPYIGPAGVSLEISVINGGPCSISPNKLSLVASNFSSSTIYYVGVYNCGNGTFEVTVLLLQVLEVDEYYVSYTHGNVFQLIGTEGIDSSVQPQPQLISALFSYDLASVLFRFDLRVNLETISSRNFTCSLIFLFETSNETECVLTSETVITAVLDYSSVIIPSTIVYWNLSALNYGSSSYGNIKVLLPPDTNRPNVQVHGPIVWGQV